MRYYFLLWLVNTLPLHIELRTLILSEATKLKEVEFDCLEVDVQWVTAALRTAQSTNLRKITITIVVDPYRPLNQVGESTHREWQDLDHLLAQLWTLRSIRPNIKYRPIEEAGSSEEVVRSLLPKLEGMGALGEV